MKNFIFLISLLHIRSYLDFPSIFFYYLQMMEANSIFYLIFVYELYGCIRETHLLANSLDLLCDSQPALSELLF